MKITKFIFLILTLVISIDVIAENQHSCLEAAMTQNAMNQCANVGHKEADAELNQVFKKIKDNYKDDKVFLDKLKKAQLAWIKLRDADFDLQYPHSNDQQYYGSVFPMCADGYKKQLTIQRIEFLKQWLIGVEEGDVCSGSKQPKNTIKAVNKEKKHLCYKNEYPFKDNPKDKDIVELNIVLSGNKVTGEYNYLPAFKDQRFGNIEGTIDNNTIKAKYTFEQEGQEDMAAISIKLNDKSAIIEGGDVALGLSDNIAKTNCKN
jgi:uncharacterized protein YecT (DUF1311 family)